MYYMIMSGILLFCTLLAPIWLLLDYIGTTKSLEDQKKQIKHWRSLHNCGERP